MKCKSEKLDPKSGAVDFEFHGTGMFLGGDLTLPNPSGFDSEMVSNAEGL